MRVHAALRNVGHKHNEMECVRELSHTSGLWHLGKRIFCRVTVNPCLPVEANWKHPFLVLGPLLGLTYLVCCLQTLLVSSCFDGLFVQQELHIGSLGL